MLSHCFRTTRQLAVADLTRLCYFLNKRTEYRNVIIIVFAGDFMFVTNSGKVEEKKVYCPTMRNHYYSVTDRRELRFGEMLHAITFSGFTERELRYWVDCFSLFGILLAENEKALRFRLNTIDIREKLQRIPTPKLQRIAGTNSNFFSVTLLDEKEKNFTITKYICDFYIMTRIHVVFDPKIWREYYHYL